MKRRLTACLLAGALLVSGSVGLTQAAVGSDSSTLRNAVTVEGILEHLEALDAIAAANDNTRVDDSPGFEASVDYVIERLAAAGYGVQLQPFEFDAFVSHNTTLERISPQPRVYVEGFNEDFVVSEFSPSGNVTAPVTPVDVVVPIGSNPPGTSTSGCEAADFASFPPGTIALLQRGTCNFSVKAENAEAAGAVGVLLFNEGQPNIPDDDRVGVINATLGEPGVVAIPVFDTSYANGAELVELSRNSGPVTLHMQTTAEFKTFHSTNVIAETASGRADRVVLLGAHLDSVTEGPGINDNGSGAATILEIAEAIADEGIAPRNKIRFAFWGGEEFGLLGAQYYVDTATNQELNRIAVNLNFDMVASPNYVRFLYDGDGSTTGAKGPSGSGNIEKVFTDYFASVGLASEPTAFDGRSDYGPFIAVGIPAGGLFTGAEDIKTAEEADIYGGVAGEPYDECYHSACDTIENVNVTALDQMSDAAAHATWAFAFTTSSPNGTQKASAKAMEAGLAKLLWRGNHRQR
ncbi:MAG TPA: M20/M25/M40 family metallo-hydrolase [Candidatus Limnocylindrales bacterium]|nr:M20/M25/M40 family metallo-hydrolase [Candidatus Limnocylindrales bacterium]